MSLPIRSRYEIVPTNILTILDDFVPRFECFLCETQAIAGFVRSSSREFEAFDNYSLNDSNTTELEIMTMLVGTNIA